MLMLNVRTLYICEDLHYKICKSFTNLDDIEYFIRNEKNPSDFDNNIPENDFIIIERDFYFIIYRRVLEKSDLIMKEGKYIFIQQDFEKSFRETDRIKNYLKDYLKIDHLANERFYIRIFDEIDSKIIQYYYLLE